MRVEFLADPDDARLAAAILARTLNRQGFPCSTHGTVVDAAVPDTAPALLLLVLDDAMLSTAGPVSDTAVVVTAGSAPASGAAVTAVAAHEIAHTAGADPVAALLGGAARALSFLDHDVLAASVWAAYDRGYGYAARAALRAFDLGYSQAHTI